MRLTRLARAAVILAGAILNGCSTTAPDTTGTLEITVTGLPGTPAVVTVSGPSGYSRTVSTTATLSNLVPGPYSIAAANVVTANATYEPSPSSTTVTVAASFTPAKASVSYTLTSGALTLTVIGPPRGVASVAVTGPMGFSQRVTATTTLSDLLPGTYTITAANVVVSNTSYGVPPFTVNVRVSNTPAKASVSYAVVSGGVRITVAGLPDGVLGSSNTSVTLSGHGTLEYVSQSPQTFPNLTPGVYTVTAYFVTQGGSTYGGGPEIQTITVLASSTPVDAGVTYAAVATGMVTGKVTNSLGAALAGVSVMVAPDAGLPLPTVQTAGDGSYTVMRVPPGLGQVVVYNVPTGVPLTCVNGAAPYTRQSGSDSTTVNAVLACTPTGLATGTLGRSRGRGIFAPTVTVTSNGGGSPSYTATNGSGDHTEATPISTGAVTPPIVPIWCTVPNGGSYSLIEGRAVTVDLLVPCNPLATDAVVGHTASDGVIVVHPASGGPALSVLTVNGYYMVTGVPVGSGTVTFSPSPPIPHRYVDCTGLGPLAYSGLTLSNTITVNFSWHCRQT